MAKRDETPGFKVDNPDAETLRDRNAHYKNVDSSEWQDNQTFDEAEAGAPCDRPQSIIRQRGRN